MCMSAPRDQTQRGLRMLEIELSTYLLPDFWAFVLEACGDDGLVPRRRRGLVLPRVARPTGRTCRVCCWLVVDGKDAELDECLPCCVPDACVCVSESVYDSLTRGEDGRAQQSDVMLIRPEMTTTTGVSDQH